MSEFLKKLFVDPSSLPQDGFGFIQVLFLGGAYGAILFNSSNLISDGSELLLLVPSLAGIVGSVVLPVLGAVPDGAIVLFSGMGPDAQEQLSVGVGALAGSTIMLLTLPWALSIIAGRVNIDSHGNANYRRPRGAPATWKKLDPDNNSLTHSGVSVGPEIATNGQMMLLTSLIYLVIQIPALKSTGTKARDAMVDDAVVADQERTYAIVGFILCLVSFLGYLFWNVRRSSQIADDTLGEVQVQAIRKGAVSLSGLMGSEFDRIAKRNTSTYGTNTQICTEDYERLETILKPFFKKYDTNHDNRMDKHEMMLFFKDLNECVSQDEIDRWFEEADSDKSGYIEFKELVEACARFLQGHGQHISSPFGRELDEKRRSLMYGEEEYADTEDADEEEDDIPDDLAGLSFEEQQKKIKLRSLYMMTVGTLAVLLFSDPMVDVLSDLGKRTGIPAFYISFIVAPLASNASELIAAYNYAQKKTSKTISISIAALLGAACMNNTFCLGIFMGLMAFKGLVWEFSAETISILVVEFIMAWYSLRRTHTLGDAILVMSIFPLSIVLILVLENVFGLD